MDKAPKSQGGKPRQKAKGKSPEGVQSEAQESISIGESVVNSAIVVGNENKIEINTFNERERKIARDILKINELLDKGQTRLAREKLAEIESLQTDFPGLESAEKRLQVVMKRQRRKGLLYAAAIAAFVFLLSAYLVNSKKRMLCETNERYYRTGVLAIAEQQVGDEVKLWIGDSNNGLTMKNEDGKIENTYGVDGLKSNSITTLEYDEKRNGMWVGTGGGGLAFIDSSQNIKHQFTLEDQIPGCKITDIVITRAGIYVTAIAGEGMGFSQDGEKWETIPIPEDYKEKEQFDIFGAVADLNGSVWVGTYQDVYQRVGENWKRYQPTPNHPLTVHAIAVDDDSIKWVGTINGLFLLDTESGTRWSRSFTIQDGLASNNITSLAIVDKNNALVGTGNGLSLCKKAGGELELVCQTIGANTGTINTITISLNGKIAHLGSEANDPISITFK
jgi:photosystem II stability/assembly factor-like uncharacterized protein